MDNLHSNIPTDYPLEEELRHAIPRPVPEFLRSGQFMRKQSSFQHQTLVAAAVCMTAQFTPFIQELSDYFPVLAFMGWLGVFLLLLYMLTLLNALRGRGEIRYLTHGEVRVVRILKLTKEPVAEQNGMETHFAIRARVAQEYPIRHTPEPETISSESLPSGLKGRYSTSLRVGDRVTALYLPERKDAPLKLYGFLGFNPEVECIQLDKRGLRFKNILTAVVAILLFVAAILTIYAQMRYDALDFPLNPFTITVLAAGALLGFAGIVVGYRLRRKGERERAMENERAMREGGAVEAPPKPPTRGNKVWGLATWVAILTMVPLLCAFSAWSALLLINGYFDTSTPAFQPVAIGECHIESESLWYREYIVPYTIEGETREHKFYTSPERFAQLSGQTNAIAVVRSGALGWSWVTDILPPEPGKAYMIGAADRSSRRFRAS